MTLTIELSPDVESRLAAYAYKQGTTAEAVVKELVEQKFTEPRTFDEILAPFRQSVAESGMTDEELEAHFEQARNEVWAEKQAREAIVPIIVTSPVQG